MNTQISTQSSTQPPATNSGASSGSACCHGKPTAASAAQAHDQPAGPHAGHGHASGKRGSWRAAASVTLHCLTGCAIGEWLGLSIGVTLGLGTAKTIALAVTLAFVCGFALTLIPLLRRGLRFAQAWKIVWIGETVSIAVMELVMNLVDYQLGGMQAGMSLLHPQYWIAFGTAALAGYLAAWPVNWWLLRRNLKNCH
jgi:apolipoprotein N-acyltransferase